MMLLLIRGVVSRSTLAQMQCNEIHIACNLRMDSYAWMVAHPMHVYQLWMDSWQLHT